MVLLSKSVYTSLASRYWDSRWSHDENRRRYGRLASPEGLGGNWKLEIGGTATEAGLDAALAGLKGLLDHRCLFTDIPEFADRASTLENVSAFLAGRFLKDPFTFLTVHESDHLSCTVRQGGMELRQRVMNLTLTIRGVVDESGLIASRERVTQSVIETHGKFSEPGTLSEREWSRTLFDTLSQSVKGLISLRVDLGSGKYIVVGQQSSSGEQ